MKFQQFSLELFEFKNDQIQLWIHQKNPAGSKKIVFLFHLNHFESLRIEMERNNESIFILRLSLRSFSIFHLSTPILFFIAPMHVNPFILFSIYPR